MIRMSTISFINIYVTFDQQWDSDSLRSCRMHTKLALRIMQVFLSVPLVSLGRAMGTRTTLLTDARAPVANACT